MSISGRYTVRNPHKYKGDPTKCIYRSTWERKLMKYCDHNPNITSWNSEEVVVPYISPVDNCAHRYFVDFWMEVRQHDQTIKHFLVEVKPDAQTKPPKAPKRLTESYMRSVQTWGVNQAKWAAATKYCIERGWQFLIITEKDLFKGKHVKHAPGHN